MPIFQAIGLGLIIIIFQLFVPRLFHSFEDTLVTTLNTAQAVLSLSQDAITNVKTPLLPKEE